ncbi:hypothetical protein CFV354_0728 [Campylobacter fetus subsp. venerealis NCTC 10354]|nr:hypothetical protein CFV354_0728 [Campylobacter fetus subsp. venerealis NCTC 10354]
MFANDNVCVETCKQDGKRLSPVVFANDNVCVETGEQR